MCMNEMMLPLKQDISKFIISPDDTIENALKKIDINLRRGLIVVENEKAVGSITDGDIRKAILSHRSLLTPVRDMMNTNFVRVRSGSRVDAKKIFEERGIFLLPVVDENMMLIDVIVRGA